MFKQFLIALKQNLREEDNLSTKDKWPVPKVSSVRRFYCIADEHQIPIYIGTYTLQMRRNSVKVLDLFEFGIQCYSQAIEIWCVLATGVETEKFHNSSACMLVVSIFFFVCMCLHGSCPCDHAGIFTG